MKIKYLFPVLAGMAMTACNSEDDLALNSANDLKTSPITFTFTEESPLSRATVGDGQSVVKFEQGDLTSLFNGLGDPWATFTNNAIYEAKSSVTDDNSAELQFSTASMVHEGNAVMIYPADTTFAAQSASKIVLNVASEQDAETKEKAPYVTDVLNIASYSGNIEKNEAGYGRNYPIMFKKVANTWRLDLNALERETIDNATIDGTTKVSPVVFQKATISNGNAEFNTSVKVVASTEDSELNNNRPGEGFGYVGKQTTYEDGTGAVATISSTDFESYTEKGVAYESFTFTVLPKMTAATLTDASIEILTNYGKVLVESQVFDEENPETYPLIPYTAGFEPTQNLNDYLQGMLNNYSNQVPTTGTWKGQEVGGILKRQFTFSFADLNMDELDIIDSEHLIDVLSVYQALGLKDGAAIHLNLNTNKEDKKFLLTSAALDKLAEVNTANKITLDVTDYSNTILLNENNLDKFNNVAVVFDYQPVVYLDATWSLAQNADLSKMASLTTEATAALTITEAANLAVGTEPKDVPFALTTPFTNNGALTVGGKIYVKEMTSNGSIAIAAGKELYTVGNTEFYGTVENKGDLTSYSGMLQNFATIAQYGTMTSLKATSAKILNGGIINIMDDNAITYLSYNISATPKYAGIINLKNRNDEVKVEFTGAGLDASRNNGYIKYEITAADDYEFEAMEGDKFNFLTFNVTKNLAKIDLNGMKDNVKFLKITGQEANIIRTNDAISLADLIIDSSARYLSANKFMTVTGGVYVKGKLTHAENISDNKKTTYNSNNYGEVDASYNGEVKSTQD